MMKAIRLFLSSLLALMLTCQGCSLDIPTENQLTDPNVVTSIQTAYEALSTAYSAYPTNHYLLSLLADDFAPLTKARLAQEQMSTYHWEPFQLEKVADQLWREYYQCIVHLNALLTRLPALHEQLKGEEIAQAYIVQAEAETLKATCYLELLQLFATRYQAPEREGIVLKDHVESEQLPRATKEATVQEIKRLLLSAQTLFEKAQKVTPMHQNHYSFVSPSATAMILARLYLYTEEYQQADYYATLALQEKQIDSSAIPTEANHWSNPKSEQTILVQANSQTFYTESFIASFKLDDLAFMLNPKTATTQTDLRHSSYAIDSLLPSEGTESTTLYLLGKYNLSNISQQEILYVPLIRKTEALFIQMEAKAQSGKEKEALQLLKNFLLTVELPTSEVEGLQGAALIDVILKEKQKEFAGENIRFFDIKRTPQRREILGVNGVLQDLYIEADDYRWTLPIPHSEYRTNLAIDKQNPGWRPFERIKTE